MEVAVLHLVLAEAAEGQHRALTEAAEARRRRRSSGWGRARPLPREPHQVVDLRACRQERGAGGEAPDDRRPIPRSPDERRPELRVGVRKLKAGTHDADNLVLNAVERDRLSKNRVVSTESALPHRVTDDRDPVKAKRLFSWLQQPAHQRRRFEHRHDLG